MGGVKYKVVAIGRTGKMHSVYAKGEYCLEYARGKITHAPKETWGISVFETERDAQKFIVYYGLYSRQMEVVKVKTFGRGIRRKCIANPDDYSIIKRWWDYKRKRPKDIDWVRLPLGTVFYPAVEVLE